VGEVLRKACFSKSYHFGDWIIHKAVLKEISKKPCANEQKKIYTYTQVQQQHQSFL
jgi:hypothetical protein